MRKYCVSYDVKNADEIDFNALKKEIVTVLIANGATVTFNSPVASTILFFDNTDENRINRWDTIISKNFSEVIFYYLCLIARDSNGNQIDRNHGDLELEKNFQRLID